MTLVRHGGVIRAATGTDGHRPHVVFHEMARARSLPGGLELWPLREGTLREEVDDLVLTFDGDAAGIVVEQAARSHNFALIAPLPWPRERWGSPLEVWHL